jgi:hypothetical protein
MQVTFLGPLDVRDRKELELLIDCLTDVRDLGLSAGAATATATVECAVVDCGVSELSAPAIPAFPAELPMPPALPELGSAQASASFPGPTAPTSSTSPPSSRKTSGSTSLSLQQTPAASGNKWRDIRTSSIETFKRLLGTRSGSRPHLSDGGDDDDD